MAKCAWYGVLFTHPVAYKGIASSYKRNSLLEKESIIVSAKLLMTTRLACQWRPATKSLKRNIKVRNNISSPLFPFRLLFLFRLLTFFDWSLSESSVFRDIWIWTLRLTSHNQNSVYRLRAIISFLHWSQLESLTIDAKCTVVLIS